MAVTALQLLAGHRSIALTQLYLHLGDGWLAEETRLILPREDKSEVLDAMDALGGSSRWGARRFGDHEVLLEAGELLEALFPRALDLLNELMLSTPVERLPHVALTPEHTAPPVNRSGSTDVWDEWVRNRIRWQLGF